MTTITHTKHWPTVAYKDHVPHLSTGFQSEAYVCGDLPPHYPVPATSLYYDGPKHVSVAYQKMVHLVTGNHDLIRDYWTRY